MSVVLQYIGTCIYVPHKVLNSWYFILPIKYFSKYIILVYKVNGTNLIKSFAHDVLIQKTPDVQQPYI